MENLQKIVFEKLNVNFSEDILSSELLYDYPVFTVRREKIIDIISFLYNEPELKFQFLTTLCGIHFPDNKGQELGVIYHLHSLTKNYRIRIKIFFNINDPIVPTLTGLFLTANWMERETFDFYGVVFKGHPNLKRILNVDEMTVFPLRKEFPLEDPTREDKNDSMFGR